MEENDVVCSPKNFVAGVPVRFLLHYCSSSPYWPLTFRTTSLKFSCCVSSKTCLFVTLALSLLSPSASTLKFRKKKKKSCFFFLSKSLGGQDDHNMDIYHQVKHKLQVRQRVKKVISNWLLCGADGTCKVTWPPKISRIHGYQFFFTHGALLWAQKLFYNTRLKVCTSNEAPSVIFVIVYFSHVMCQQKVGSYGFITWNLIMCNNNVTVVTEVLFIWLLPPIMWYILTCICLTV